MTSEVFLKCFTMMVLKKLLNGDTKSLKRFPNDDVKNV